MLDLLSDNPIGHGVDVATDDTTAHAIGFEKRRATAHERVGNSAAVEIVAFVEGLPKRRFDELRKYEPPEKRPGPTGEPLVNGYQGTVVLLDLLLTQSQTGHKWYVKTLLYHDST